MSSMKVVPLALAMLAAGWVTSYGQPFVSGSDGSDGALDIPASSISVTITLDPDFDGDSVYHFTTITIGANNTVLFPQNDLNSPIVLLATGDITIDGIIAVNGTQGTVGAGGVGGPGGFDGGFAGGTDFPPGDGFGPGHGKRADLNRTTGDTNAGNAAYGTAEAASEPADGSTYGSPLLVPMVGGSGGGGGEGQPGTGGGGGGGAILIASTTRIELSSTGRINALGGSGAGGNGSGAGSGGAIRLVAPVIEGSGRLNTDGGIGTGIRAGDGRVRVDAIDRRGMAFSFDSTTQAIGSFMAVFPSTVPRLDIIGVAGTAIGVGASSVVLQLPFGDDPNKTVVVQGTDFLGDVDIRLVVTPESGDSVTYDDTIVISGGTGMKTVNVVIPVNTVAHIAVWTR